LDVNAVAKEVLRLLALADESAELDFLRVAAVLHHPSRGALRLLAPATGEVGDAAELRPLSLLSFGCGLGIGIELGNWSLIRVWAGPLGCGLLMVAYLGLS
jgi:hypothetical protein